MAFQKRNPPIGSRPGTLAIPPNSLPPKVHRFSYDQNELEEEAVEDVSKVFNDKSRVDWIDVQGLGDETSLRAIAEALEIHPLALEDVVNAPQRAKAELYDEHLFVVARLPLRENGELVMVQVAILLGDGYVATFQERYRGLFDPVRERLRRGGGQLRENGSDYLAYVLLDALVDHYFPVVEDLSSRLDDLEDEVIESPHPDIQSEVYELRRELVRLRRVGRPQREVVNRLANQEIRFITPKVRIFFRDTNDHMAQVVELADAMREVALAIMEMYLSSVGNKTNDIMKVLTLMASIFIPLTFIAGIYGMNFEHMPELKVSWAYPLALSAMAVIGSGMLFFFHRRGWLGQPARRPRRPSD